MPRKRAPKAKALVRVFLDSIDLDVIDRMVSEGAYTSRSDAIRDIVRDALRQKR